MVSHADEEASADPTGEQTPIDADSLLPLVYGELHRLAQQIFRRQRSDHTLQPTALVHEVYLRLCSGENARWEDRRHFFCVAARAMRQILVNHARDKGRQKRGGGRQRVSLDQVAVADGGSHDMLELNAAIERLAQLDERKARVVELRYFAGLSVEETADVIGVSAGTVKGDWALAKAWLLRHFAGDG